jgi:peptidyl-prolyl cis-trans isomerase SurA
MTARTTLLSRITLGALLALVVSLGPLAQAQPAARRNADYIVAVVNRELVTSSEVAQRARRLQQEGNADRNASTDWQRQALDQLIDERAQLGHARDSGIRIEETEVDRAVAGIASQNEMSVAQLRERLREEGVDYQRYRSNIRDQMTLERVREREVQARLRITDAEIESWLDDQRRQAGAATEYNIAQILIRLPEGGSAAEVSERRAVALGLLQRLRAGASFQSLVAEASEGSKERGGELGLRRGDRLPDLFVEAIRPLKPGEVAPQLVRSGAGLHILKLVERKEASLSVTQYRSRHILLRPAAGASQQAVIARLADYRRQIVGNRARFEELARQHSEDGSAANGGDLGWVGPGQFVPEFEQAVQRLKVGELSEPVVSRFGVHLIQLMEQRSVNLGPKEQREAARSALRERKYPDTYADWAREVRARAYVELRDEPGL